MYANGVILCIVTWMNREVFDPVGRRTLKYDLAVYERMVATPTQRSDFRTYPRSISCNIRLC